MIGNDIVDLDLAAQESNIRRRGFVDKLFLLHEKQIIENAIQQAPMLWLLWSCKEAVYKIVHRATHERKFAPQQFACYLLSSRDTEVLSSSIIVNNDCPVPQVTERMAGIVVHQQQPYYFQTRITTTCIHTHAAINPVLLQQMNVFTGCYSDRDMLSPTQLLFKDESGIPHIRDRDTGLAAPVSLSHHGRYFGMVHIS